MSSVNFHKYVAYLTGKNNGPCSVGGSNYKSKNLLTYPSGFLEKGWSLLIYHRHLGSSSLPFALSKAVSLDAVRKKTY